LKVTLSLFLFFFIFDDLLKTARIPSFRNDFLYKLSVLLV
jgi:hypothetical protein